MIIFMYVGDKVVMTFTGPAALAWCAHWIAVMAHQGTIASCVISYTI